jgi:hypothetical protein
VGDGVHAGGQTFLELLPRTQQKCAHRGRRPEGEIAMDFRTILVPIEQHDLMNSTLETALLLARKFDSYIEGFALRGAIPAYATVDAGTVAIPQLEQDIAENAQRSQSLFESFSKSMVCRVEVTQQLYQANGWKIPLRATILSAAMAGSSM